MTGRHILRPSNAVRWASDCHGSFAFEAQYPVDEDSDEAREGQAGHFYVTEALQGRYWPVGHATPNGWPIDQDMVDGGEYLLADVRRALATCSPTYTLRVEQPLTMYVRIHPHCEGTPDVTLVDMATGRIWLWDYKYGHRWVDPYKCKQLTAYFAGLLEGHQLTDADVANVTVSLRIVSPRNFQAPDPVRDWTTTGAELVEDVRALFTAAYLAKLPAQPVRTGEHCRDCTGRHECPALQAVGAYVLDLARQPVPSPLAAPALGMTLANITAAMRRLKALEDGLQAEATAMIKRGQQVPGWGVSRKKTRVAWLVDTPAVVELGKLYGVDVLKPTDKASVACITPTQARDAGIPADMLEHYARAPLGEEALIPVEASAATKVFGKGPTQ